MIQINDNLLQEIGLANLPQVERRSLLNHIYETLELRVGMRLADQMSNEQLDEFEKYFEAKDDKGAFNWLETNFPNYKDIVQQEFDKLKGEVSRSAPQILNASAQAISQGQPQPPQPQVSTQYQQPQSPYPPQPPTDLSQQQPVPNQQNPVQSPTTLPLENNSPVPDWPPQPPINPAV
jgi:hypothetical protein